MLAGTIVAPAAMGASSTRGKAAISAPSSLSPSGPILPDRGAFAAMGNAYLDSGTMHPIAVGAQQAVVDYLSTRGQADKRFPMGATEERVKANYARLINASPDEIAFVQSTTVGEHLVLAALGFPKGGGRIVTDTLHFFGSFYLYEQMAKQGVEVTWVRPVDNRIRIEDMDKAIVSGIKLVVLSLVSTYNGYEHDLKAVCDIAHARGALVYADIVHAAGTIPIDVKASGVDFASTSTYKWLMGDFGLGFLYVRADVRARLDRPVFGYYQLSHYRSHVYPYDPPGAEMIDSAPTDDAEGMFAIGTHSHTVVAQLDWSLRYLLDIGVENIMAYRQPLLQKLHQGLATKGYDIVTPPDSRTPLISCVLEKASDRLVGPLKDAGVKITLMPNRFRISLSFFNTGDDVERLLAALPTLSA